MFNLPRDSENGAHGELWLSTLTDSRTVNDPRNRRACMFAKYKIYYDM